MCRISARFIVEKRVGQSLAGLLPLFSHVRNELFNPIQRLILAIKIFSNSVQLLRGIHNIGIIHGDIHPGNIALADYKADPGLKLKESLG
jgi:hypothetical protein